MEKKKVQVDYEQTHCIKDTQNSVFIVFRFDLCFRIRIRRHGSEKTTTEQMIEQEVKENDFPQYKLLYVYYVTNEKRLMFF